MADPIYLTVEESVVEILEIGQVDFQVVAGGDSFEDTDELEVRISGDVHRVSGLRKSDGSALDNPFLVSEAGGVDHWSVLLPTSRAVDLYNNTDGEFVMSSRLLRPPVLHFSDELTGDVPESLLYDVRVFAQITSPAGDSLETDGSIIVTFSESVTGVTCNGDGSGTLEATDGTSYASGVSGSGDTYTLSPPAGGWIEGAEVVVTISPVIAASADASQLYDGVGFLLAVVEATPDTEAPVMSAFVCEAASSDANVAISALSATDDRAVTAYQVNTSAVAPDPDSGTWQSAAAWIANGYDTGLGAGADQSVTLYAWAKDAAGNISMALTDSCQVTIPLNTAPSAPVISFDSVGYTSATITLDTASTDTEDGTVTNYNVYVDGGLHAGDVTINQGETYRLTGLTTGVQVAITLKAEDSGGLESSASNSVNATPAGTEIDIAWPSSDDTAESRNLIWYSPYTTGQACPISSKVTIPAGATEINQVALRLADRKTSQTGTGDIQVDLYSDSAGEPGSFIATLGTIADFNSSESAVTKTLSDLAQAVTSETDYHIVLSVTSPSGNVLYRWWGNTFDSANPSHYQAFNGDGSWTAETAFTHSLQVAVS